MSLTWPPVITRFFVLQEDVWSPVAPGTIPLARGCDRIRIEVTAQLPIVLQVFVVTHRRTGSEPRRFITRKLITRDQTKSVELELDDEPGFEQILIYLAWPTQRGMVEVAPAPAALDTPRLHTLQRERTSLMTHTGAGWMEEYLVHHL